MNKLEKELEKELENAIQVEVPQPDLTRLNKFKPLLEQNKQSKKSNFVLRRVLISCVVVLTLFATAMIPFLFKKDKEVEVVKYYSDNEITKVNIDDQFLQTYLENNIPNYTFILEDCQWGSGLAVYAKEDSSSLLALSFKVIKRVVPIPDVEILINVEVNIILNKKFIFSETEYYTHEAVIQNFDNMTIYTREVDDVDYMLYTLIERSSYNTFVLMDANDIELLNKFKQN